MTITRMLIAVLAVAGCGAPAPTPPHHSPPAPVIPLSIDVVLGDYFAVVYARDDAHSDCTCSDAQFPAAGVCSIGSDVPCSCPGAIDPLALCLTRLSLDGGVTNSPNAPQIAGWVAFPIENNDIDPTTADLTLTLEGCGSSASIALPKLPRHAPAATASSTTITLAGPAPRVESGCGQAPASTFALSGVEEMLGGPQVVRTPYGDARVWTELQQFSDVAVATRNTDGTFSIPISLVDVEITTATSEGYAGLTDAVDVRVAADGTPLALSGNAEADSTGADFPITAVRVTFDDAGDRIELDMNGTTFAAEEPHAYRGGGLDEAQGFVMDLGGPAHFDDVNGQQPAIEATDFSVHAFTRSLMVSALAP